METTTDKKPAPPATKPTGNAQSTPPKPEAIPVALVYWDRSMQLPGKISETSLRSEKASNGKGWAVDYMPALRQFRVTYTDPQPDRSKVVYVPVERAVTWEPAS